MKQLISFCKQLRPKNGMRAAMLALGGAMALLGSSCEQTNNASVVRWVNGRAVIISQPTAAGAHPRCPVCGDNLLYLTNNQCSQEGAQTVRAPYTWVCNTHGVVAASQGTNVAYSTCFHHCGKAPARIVPYYTGYTPGVLLLCSGCGAGGNVLLNVNGTLQRHYCGE